MEEMSFKNILHLLSTKQATLPILDCYLVEKNESISHFELNKQQQCALIPEQSTLTDVLNKIYREIVLLQKLGMTRSLGCFFYIDQRRHKIAVQDLEMMLATGSIPPDVNIIQLLKPNMIDGMLAYSFTMDVLNKKETLYFCQNDIKNKVNEPSVMHSVQLIAKSILKSIEKQASKIDIDFVIDADGQLWITHIRQVASKLSKSVSFQIHKTLEEIDSNDQKNASICRNKAKLTSNASPRSFKKSIRKKHAGNCSMSQLHSQVKSRENAPIITNRYKNKIVKAKPVKKLGHAKNRPKMSNCTNLSYTAL